MLGRRRGRARWIALVVAVVVAGASFTMTNDEPVGTRHDLEELHPLAAPYERPDDLNGDDGQAVLDAPFRVLPTLNAGERWWYLKSPQSGYDPRGRVTSFGDPERPTAAVSAVVAPEGYHHWRAVRRLGRKDPVDVGSWDGFRWSQTGRTFIAWRPAKGVVALVIGRGVSDDDLLRTARSFEIEHGRPAIRVFPASMRELASHTVGVRSVGPDGLLLEFSLPTLYETEKPPDGETYWSVSAGWRDDSWLAVAEALDQRVRHLEVGGRAAVLIPDEHKLVVLFDESHVITLQDWTQRPEELIALASDLTVYEVDEWRAMASALLDFTTPADVVIDEQRTATSHVRLSLEGHDPVSDFGRLCTQERTITSFGNEPRCYAVAVGTSRDRCDYESGWTIGFGSPYTGGEDLLYGTVRSDVTAGEVVLDDGERIPLRLSKVPGGSAFQVFSAPIPSGRTLASAVAMAPGGTLRARWVERPWANNLRSWFEDPTAGLGIAQHIYSGMCPG